MLHSIKNFLWRGPAFSISGTPLVLIKAIKLYRCLWSECCFLLPLGGADHWFRGKKNKMSKEKVSARNGLWADSNALKIFPDQTNVRLSPPPIIPFPSWSDLWSDHLQTEVTSDQTIPRPKWPLIKPCSDQCDLWQYFCALEPNFCLGALCVRWNWSNQRSL